MMIMGNALSLPTLRLVLATPADLHWAQEQVAQHHYLKTPVDVRCNVLCYIAMIGRERVGCLVFGRPEATRCYVGALTYGSLHDVQLGRAEFDRWEILNLARVWLDPSVQAGGAHYHAEALPGFVDRQGVWRSAAASWLIGKALRRVGYDYLCAFLPVDCRQPYQIRAVLSYCDTRHHRGAIYRAAQFNLARENEDGIQTWWTHAIPLSTDQDANIQRWSEQSHRSRVHRSQRRVAHIAQLQLVEGGRS